MKEYLNGSDVDYIKITKIKDKDSGFTKDITIDFPKDYEPNHISFVDSGLINASPEVKEYISNGVPKVTIDFYGNLEEIEE